MGKDARWEPTDYAAKLIKFKAKQLVSTHGFTEGDRDDIEQELLLSLWLRLEGFDPRRGHLNAFTKTIIRTAVANLVERQQAAKRGGGRRHVSVDDEVGSEKGKPLRRGDLLDQDAALRRLGRSRRQSTEEADLRMAVQEALDSLGPDTRSFAGQLLELTLTELSRATGIARGTLFDRILKLRKPFSEAGLEEFLPRSRRAGDEPGT